MQGTIFYNSENHWASSFLTVVEIGRITTDFGQFQLPVRWFKRPLAGWMHGSFFLMNGRVENAIGWETNCLAEDFWFAARVRQAQVKPTIPVLT